MTSLLTGVPKRGNDLSLAISDTLRVFLACSQMASCVHGGLKMGKMGIHL